MKLKRSWLLIVHTDSRTLVLQDQEKIFESQDLDSEPQDQA